MKKQTIFTIATVAFAAGSIFAFVKAKEVKPAAKKVAVEKCIPQCCDGSQNICEPNSCG